MLLGIVVNIIYLANMYNIQFIDAEYRFEDGKCIISEISARGPAKRAGLQAGDIVLAIDSITINDPEQLYSAVGIYEIGDTLTYRILRNNEEFTATRIPSSYMQEAPVLYYFKYLLILLFSCACIYVLYKKPDDRTAVIFFIYSQICSVFHIGTVLPFDNFFANFASSIL